MFKSATENYEIIRFVEQGNRCRPAMDCVQGELLIYRIRRCPEAEKEEVFGWIRELAQQLEKFHRCRNGQCYRYVNPYSVLITRAGHIALLDLEAESNAFVLKNMQKRAMRNHFVKPLLQIRENTRLFADFYGYGKTVQFMIASTILDQPLTFGEKRKLYRLTEKCICEETKNGYTEFAQILRDVPHVKSPDTKRKMRMLAASVGIVLFAVSAVMYQALTVREEHTPAPTVQIESVSAADTAEGGVQEAKKQEAKTQEAVASEKEEITELSTKAAAILGEQLALQTTEGNQAVIRSGENLHREVLRCLAEAYVREKQTEQALGIFQELCMVETDTNLLRETYLKKIDLEQEIGDDQTALETGREASLRFAESKDIQLAYLKTIYRCETVDKGERKQEAEELLRRYPFLKETEIYLQLEKEHPLFTETESVSQEVPEEKTEENTKENPEEKSEEKSEAIPELMPEENEEESEEGGGEGNEEKK